MMLTSMNFHLGCNIFCYSTGCDRRDAWKAYAKEVHELMGGVSL